MERGGAALSLFLFALLSAAVPYGWAAEASRVAPGGDDQLAQVRAFYRELRETPPARWPDSRTGAAIGAPAPVSLGESASGPGRRLLSVALSYRGIPYRWGGAGKSGMDCSGLVVRAAAGLGSRLPHSAKQLYEHGVSVASRDLAPGDLVFFRGVGEAGISHVGVSAGGTRFVHASSTQRMVALGDLSTPHFRRTYAGAKRLPGLAGATHAAAPSGAGETRVLWAPLTLLAPGP